MTAEDQRREDFDRCNREGVLTATWQAHPTAPAYTNMRIVVSKALLDENGFGTTIAVRYLTVAQAVKLVDELQHAIDVSKKHIAEGTGSE